MTIPADGFLLEQQEELKVDESALTGEKLLIRKGTLKESIANGFAIPVLFSGTLLTHGAGRFIVLAVGPNTLFAQIQKMTKK